MKRDLILGVSAAISAGFAWSMTDLGGFYEPIYMTMAPICFILSVWNLAIWKGTR